MTCLKKDWLMFWLGVAVVTCAHYTLAGALFPHATSVSPPGHYGLLTEAVLAGQTYLKLAPDPSLLALENPYDNTHAAVRLHDASLYQGRYYLYFGISPVLLLLAPWRLLFGTYLQEGVASSLFAWVGFFEISLIFVFLKKRFLPRVASRWTFAAVLLLGLGNFALAVTVDTRVYPVAILCAFACVMAAWLAVCLALVSRTTARRSFWIAVMSLALGFAVGARPNMMFAIPAYLSAVLCLWEKSGRGADNTHDSRNPWILFWAVLPLMVSAAGLAAYNYARFGSVFEFGVHWQLASYDPRHMQFLSLRNIPRQLFESLLSPAVYSPYFPFLTQSGDTLGAFSFAPLTLAGLCFPLSLRRRDLGKNPVWIVAGFTGLLATLGVLGALCLYPFANARYALDFVPALLLLGFLTALTALDSAPAKTWRRRAIASVLVIAVLWTAAHSIFLLLGSFSDSPRIARIAQLLNRVSFAAERAAGVAYGPIELTTEFPKIPVGATQALVTTGSGRDEIYIRGEASGKVRFGFFHVGVGGSLGDEIEAKPGVVHRVKIDLGSLYPPENHPVWKGWARSDIALLLRRLEVSCDGEVVLRRDISFYGSSAKDIGIGEHSQSVAGAPAYTGVIKEISRLGIPSSDSLTREDLGPVRIHLLLKPYQAEYNEPLLSTGTPEFGDLIYITYAGPNRIKFGHDHRSYGLYETPVVVADSSLPHSIDIDVPTLRDTPTGVTGGNLKIALDGCLICSVERPFYPSHSGNVSVGFNAVRGSSASAVFGGSEFSYESIPKPRISAIPSGELGLMLRFRMSKPGLHEPLLTTGKTGKGDFIYVVYEAANRIRFGYDHWGVSGEESAPIEIDPAYLHTLKIRTGSLYPPSSDSVWGRVAPARREVLLNTLVVTLDGKVVFEKPLTPHPTSPDELTIGKNFIGGSNNTEAFGGDIISLQFGGLPEDETSAESTAQHH